MEVIKMNRHRIPTLLLLLSIVPGVSCAQSSADATLPSPLREIARHVSEKWMVVKEDDTDGYHFEKRASMPYRRFGMCARSVIEAEAPIPPGAVDDDDVINSIRIYRLYAFPVNGKCQSKHDVYFHAALDGISEEAALSISRDLHQKRWAKAVNAGRTPKFEFDEAISEAQRACLHDEKRPLEITDFRVARKSEVISGSALIGSCSTSRSKVVLHFSGGNDSKLEFKRIPKEMIEG